MEMPFRYVKEKDGGPVMPEVCVLGDRIEAEVGTVVTDCANRG